MTSEIKVLNRWLELPGNSRAKLAAQLGYSTSVTIAMWIKRESIPANRIQQVMEYINGSSRKGIKRKNKKAASRSSVRNR